MSSAAASGRGHRTKLEPGIKETMAEIAQTTDIDIGPSVGEPIGSIHLKAAKNDSSSEATTLGEGEEKRSAVSAVSVSVPDSKMAIMMDGREIQPVFEMVVLGSGGGPLETDCSG